VLFMFRDRIGSFALHPGQAQRMKLQPFRLAVSADGNDYREWLESLLNDTRLRQDKFRCAGEAGTFGRLGAHGLSA